MTEKDIAEYVIQWLKYQNWEVWQEVCFYRGSAIHDIVATRNGLMWIIEVKKSLSLSVLAQARRAVAHFVSVAVLKGDKRHYNKGANFAEFICKQQGIGVILVDGTVMQKYIKHKKEKDALSTYGYWERMIVDQHIPPDLKRSAHSMVKKKIDDLGTVPKNFCKAGSENGGYWTPYKQTIKDVRSFLKDNPGSTGREIIDGIKEHHYASDKSAYSSLVSALQQFEKEWCYFRRTKKGFKFYIRKGKE